MALPWACRRASPDRRTRGGNRRSLSSSRGCAGPRGGVSRSLGHVAQPEGTEAKAIKVGVSLARQPDDLGEWLADAAAFEAAGVDVLCVDLAPESELDPLALTAALAVVTFRSLLVAVRPAPDGPFQALERMVTTAGQLSRGRLRVLAGALPREELGGLTEIGGGLGERWVSAPAPDSRATWRATLADAAERGAQGLLVPAGPRLLDILRNPDDPGERPDLQLSQG